MLCPVCLDKEEYPCYQTEGIRFFFTVLNTTRKGRLVSRSILIRQGLVITTRKVAPISLRFAHLSQLTGTLSVDITARCCRALPCDTSRFGWKRTKKSNFQVAEIRAPLPAWYTKIKARINKLYKCEITRSSQVGSNLRQLRSRILAERASRLNQANNQGLSIST